MEANTGLLLWDAGQALAHLVLACPGLVQGKVACEACLNWNHVLHIRLLVQWSSGGCCQLLSLTCMGLACKHVCPQWLYSCASRASSFGEGHTGVMMLNAVKRLLSVAWQRSHSCTHACWHGPQPPVSHVMNHHQCTGQHVVELGCGASPLLALACLRHCRSYTGTDGSKRALSLLARNLAANSRWYVCTRSMSAALRPLCVKQVLDQEVGLLGIGRSGQNVR